MTTNRLLLALVFAVASPLLPAAAVEGQAIVGTCTSCGGGAPDPNCGACIASGTSCFNALMPADRRLGVFETSDHHDALSLTYGRLVRGAQASATDINRAVNTTYNGNNIWLYYGAGAPAGFCAPAGGPPRAFAADADYHFPWEHRFEDALDHLDCYNAEIDRYYLGAAGHGDGSRVCDGEQSQFDPAAGAIFDLGGEGNRVVVFPFTDHGPLPCESWEYSVWLSDDPMATQVASPSAPDSRRWNPAVLTTVFLEGWIPDSPAPANETAALSPDLGNPTQHDGIVQVFALPCGLTFRYASIVAGNNGNPTAACQFWSFDAELDAVAGLNEDNTAICPDADGDGFRDAACGGTDCNDANAMVHPGAFERCDATMDLDCEPMHACPTGTVCSTESGLCVSQCFEGTCAAGYTCVGNTACVETACAMRTESCPVGTLCRGGDCVSPCDGVVCPSGQRCTSGACLDPCQGVDCPVNQVCIARDPSALSLCGPACTCSDLSAPLCPSTQACDTRTTSPTFGTCVDPGCDTTTCAAGQHCVAGACQNACAGVTCPHGQTCATGACTVDLCAAVTCPTGRVCRAGTCVDPCDGVTCSAGQVCQAGSCVADPCAAVDCGPTAHCVGGTCVANTTDAGARTDAGHAMDSGVHGSAPPSNAGCGCRASGTGGGSVAWLALALGAMLARRRASRRDR